VDTNVNEESEGALISGAWSGVRRGCAQEAMWMSLEVEEQGVRRCAPPSRGIATSILTDVRSNFSSTGNFGFGIEEHIDLGIKYDPGIGIFGMDFFVVMGRPGMRVAKRKRAQGKIGFQHKVKVDNTIAWYKQRFDGIVSR
jgi:hypothetical protein